MKKLTKLKQIFNLVKKTITTKDLYICNMLLQLHKDGFISKDLYDKSMLFLEENKPSDSKFTEYTEHPLWFGTDFIWWSPINEKAESSVRVYLANKKAILKIKKQYLTKLIKTIK